MSNLFEQLESLIQNTIQNYAQQIAEKYEIDQEELLDLWKEVSGTVAQLKPIKRKTPPKKSAASSGGPGCPYVFVKGGREGESCGKNPVDGGTYCSRHAKYESEGQKTKKQVAAVGSKITSRKKSPKRDAKHLPFAMHKKLKKLWNKDTGMYLKSKEEQIVIGKIVDDQFCRLEEDDCMICDEYTIPYDSDQFDGEDENNDVAEETADVVSTSPKIKIKPNPATTERKMVPKKLSTKKALPPLPDDDDDEEEKGEQLKDLKTIANSVQKAFNTDASMEDLMNDIQEGCDDDDVDGEGHFMVADDDDE